MAYGKKTGSNVKLSHRYSIRSVKFEPMVNRNLSYGGSGSSTTYTIDISCNSNSECIYYPSNGNYGRTTYMSFNNKNIRDRVLECLIGMQSQGNERKQESKNNSKLQEGLNYVYSLLKNQGYECLTDAKIRGTQLILIYSDAPGCLGSKEEVHDLRGNYHMGLKKLTANFGHESYKWTTYKIGDWDFRPYYHKNLFVVKDADAARRLKNAINHLISLVQDPFDY